MGKVKQAETPAQLIMRALCTHHNSMNRQTLGFWKMFELDSRSIDNEKTEISITLEQKKTRIEIFGEENSSTMKKIVDTTYDHQLSCEEIKKIIESIFQKKSNADTSYQFSPDAPTPGYLVINFKAGMPQASKNGAKLGYGVTELSIAFRCSLKQEQQIMEKLCKDLGKQIDLKQEDIKTLLETEEKRVKLSVLEYLSILNPDTVSHQQRSSCVKETAIGEFGINIFPIIDKNHLKLSKEPTLNTKIEDNCLLLEASLISSNQSTYAITRKIPLSSDISEFFEGKSAREVIENTIETLRLPYDTVCYPISKETRSEIADKFEDILYGKQRSYNNARVLRIPPEQ